MANTSSELEQADSADPYAFRSSPSGHHTSTFETFEAFQPHRRGMPDYSSVVLIGVPVALGVLPDGDLDSLRCEALAQWRALYDTREFLRRVDLELVGVNEGEHGCSGLVQSTTKSGIANVDEVHAESVE